MDERSKLKSEADTKPDASSLLANSAQATTQSELNQQAPSNRRRAAQSKREIMEQLSRERFPWDE
jgi:hypothetical protein